MLKFLSDLQETDRQWAGHKAANLAVLMKAGLPVPAGCVYGWPANRADSISSPSGSLPEADRGAVLAAFAQLGRLYVAVRSSSTSEDSPRASQAGQFATFLNVPRQQLLEKIDRVWASTLGQGKSNRSAVIIQAMRPSIVSGVLFTAHPISGDRDIIYIEAVDGLGLGLTSGEIIPDAYEIQKSSRQILKTDTHIQKSKMVACRGGGVAWRRNRHGQAKLAETQLNELAGFASQVEILFGCPQDIEWGIYRGKIIILQTRPISQAKLSLSV